MKESKKNALIELLTNEDFKKWVLEPTHERDTFWKKWIESNPDKEDIVKLAREFILSTSYRELDFGRVVKDDMLSNIISKSPLDSQQMIPPSISQRSRRFVTAGAFKWVAAVLVAVSFLGIGYWYVNQQENQELNTATYYIRKETPPGKRASLSLPDGTMVTLNSNTTLTYDTDYGRTDRTVQLIGEAFFEVKKTAAKPFSVITNGYVTTVLGTSFNVRAIESDSIIKISLKSGKLMVGNLKSKHTGPENVLDPGEGFRIRLEGNRSMEKFSVNPLIDFGWKEGILAFKDNSLDEVIQALERWYNVTITVTGEPKKQWRFDGEYDNEPLGQVLKGMSFTYGLEYQISGKNVQLKF